MFSSSHVFLLLFFLFQSRPLLSWSRKAGLYHPPLQKFEAYTIGDIKLPIKMEASDRLAMRQQQSRKRKLRMLWCGVALLLIIGALAIGLGVGLTQTLSGGDDGVSEEFGAQIMVPLFNEPVNGSWDP